MTIKAIAFEVQSGLSRAHGIALKRSHVREVLAALFGFASYAALTSQRLLGQHYGSVRAVALDIKRAEARAQAFGHTFPETALIAAATARIAEAEHLCVISLDDLLLDLGIDNHLRESPGRTDDASGVGDVDANDEWEAPEEDLMFSIELESPVLRESLHRMADAGSASAHLALAELGEESLSNEDDETSAGDGRYWFAQQQSGRTLTGVELEWADAYRRKQDAVGTRRHHLQRAISLGSAEAALKLLEDEPSAENFELAARMAGAPQATRLGYNAMFFERDDEARKWFRVAAREGDTDAMKMLASRLETDPKEAWTWVHLAKLCGGNIMAYHAVGDDGLTANASRAGPIYPAGGFDLDPLSDEDNADALEAARSLHAKLAGSA